MSTPEKNLSEQALHFEKSREVHESTTRKETRVRGAGKERESSPFPLPCDRAFSRDSLRSPRISIIEELARWLLLAKEKTNKKNHIWRRTRASLVGLLPYPCSSKGRKITLAIRRRA